MTYLTLLYNVGTSLCYMLLAFASSILLWAIPAVYQEWKIWSDPTIPSLSPIGMLKVYVFNVGWMSMSLIGSIFLFPKYVINGFGGVEFAAQSVVARNVALFLVRLFVGPVRIDERENLPSENEPCVYISNHGSQIDLGVMYFPLRRFKWIAKKSVVYLPGVGQIMLLGEHCFIDRKAGKDKRESVKSMYAAVNKSIQNGTSIMIFPQGTRRMAERLPFKDGAFNIAMGGNANLVPVSIDIPICVWNDLYPFNMLWGNARPIVITVHKPVKATKDSDKENLKKVCEEAIYSVLPAFTKKKTS